MNDSQARMEWNNYSIETDFNCYCTIYHEGALYHEDEREDSGEESLCEKEIEEEGCRETILVAKISKHDTTIFVNTIRYTDSKPPAQHTA